MAHSPDMNDSNPSLTALARDRGILRALADRYRASSVTTPFEVAGFWSAIALPFLYVPLLVTGIESMNQFVAVLVLVAFNVLALFAGHNHRR